MKKVLALSSIILFSASLASCGNKYSEQDIINVMVNEATSRIANAKRVGFQRDVVPESALKEYPTQFDLRSVDTNNDGIKENYVTGVKFQNPFGTCWAFGTIAAAETSILYDLKQDAVKDGKDSINLSEHHLGWFAYTPLPDNYSQKGEGLYSQVSGVDKNPSLRLNSGSTQYAATSVFANAMGPVQEPDFDTATGIEAMLNYRCKDKNDIITTKKGYKCYNSNGDWSVDESLRIRPTFMLEDSYILPNSVYIKDDGKYDVDYADLVVKSYKEQLTKGRGLVISFQADNYSPSAEDRVAKYINTDTWAHYTYVPTTANHSVCVIGWDDNYSKNNFLSEVQETVNGKPAFDKDGNPIMRSVPQPPKDGAWIVKNSWGALNTISDGLNENAWGINDTGYFYLSYYDMSLTSVQGFDFDVTNSIPSSLGNYVMHSYDYMPTEYPRSIETNFPVEEGNLFTASSNEIVKHVSCISTKANENIEFTFYPVKGDKVDVDHPYLHFDKTFVYPGIHIIPLPTPIELNQGDQIAVCITQKANDKYYLSIGSEYNKKGFDAGLCEDQYIAKGVVNKGESFVILENQVFDLSDIKNKVENMEGATSFVTYDNFPIKIYATIK